MSSRPLVSIGMPVHNADRHLRDALDSLLAQDYRNLEIVISDNASSDSTEAICSEYARRDDRVTYHRLDENQGAVSNFNRVFALAHGTYFMWAAHDDVRAPRFVSCCVDAMEKRPDAGLCCSEVAFIDEEGKPVEPWTALHHPTGATTSARLSAIARSRFWLDVYGLIRSEVLATTTLAQPVWGFDVSILLQLCLRGPVLFVPEPLFHYRVDPAKSTRGVADTLGAAAVPGRISVSWTGLVLALARDVREAPLGALQRALLAVQLMIQMCVFNGIVGSGIRKELGRSFGEAWSGRRWGRLAVLVLMAAMVLPVHNRLVRSVVRTARRQGGPPRGDV